MHLSVMKCGRFSLSQVGLSKPLAASSLANLGVILFLVTASCGSVSLAAAGQTLGTSGTIQGSVLDPTGAAVVGASVQIHNPVSGYKLPIENLGVGLSEVITNPSWVAPRTFQAELGLGF